MSMPRLFVSAVVAVTALTVSLPVLASSYDDLVSLFHDWRAFEQPPLLNGAPDYTAETTARRHGELSQYQDRLYAMEIADWPIEQQIDWHLVRAEMNGMDFNVRVLKSWARDPAFYQSVWTYQSDTPAHEGPTHHALVELWTYEFPLDEAAEEKLTAELKTIPPLLEQARVNLTGNARELWLAGIKHIDDQVLDLENLASRAGDAGPALRDALNGALSATKSFASWLREQGETKTGPSGIGKDNYTWYLQNVHLVPLTWEDEVRLFVEERASFSPDGLTGMEANLRFAGPETMETKIFGRLTAWQNWIFQRPNAVGDDGALKRYGSGQRPDYDFTRV